MISKSLLVPCCEVGQDISLGSVSRLPAVPSLRIILSNLIWRIRTVGFGCYWVQLWCALYNALCVELFSCRQPDRWHNCALTLIALQRPCCLRVSLIAPLRCSLVSHSAIKLSKPPDPDDLGPNLLNTKAHESSLCVTNHAGRKQNEPTHRRISLLVPLTIQL